MIKQAIVKDKNILILLSLYSFLLLFFCSKMSPLYPINEWSDVNLYYNIGKAIFNGRTLYTEAFDHKGPLIFFIYGIGYAISNTSFIGMYLIEAFFWTAMICCGYLTARLSLDKIYAFAVALIFPLFVLSHSSEGGSAEEFILVFEVVSLLLFLNYFNNNNSKHAPRYMFIHGVMSAATILIKINLVVFWLFPLLAILIAILKNKDYKNLIANIAAYIGGMLILFLPIFIYFVYNNALSEAWNTYIVLNGKYAQLDGFVETIENLAIKFYQRLRFDTFEYLVILIGAFYFPIQYIQNDRGRLAIILSFISLHIAIFISPNYVFYYSMPYYIFSLLGSIAIIDILSRMIKVQARWYLYVLFSFFALAIGIREKNFFSLSTAELLRKEEPNNPAFLFSNIVMKESNPTLLNLGLDLGNGVFTKANTVPNVKYFISPNLPHSIYPEMREEQTKYIENKEVQFIILSEFSLNFDYFFNLPALNENYKIVDTYIEDKFKTYYLYKLKD